MLENKVTQNIEWGKGMNISSLKIVSPDSSWQVATQWSPQTNDSRNCGQTRHNFVISQYHKLAYSFLGKATKNIVFHLLVDWHV